MKIIKLFLLCLLITSMTSALRCMEKEFETVENGTKIQKLNYIQMFSELEHLMPLFLENKLKCSVLEVSDAQPQLGDVEKIVEKIKASLQPSIYNQIVICVTNKDEIENLAYDDCVDCEMAQNCPFLCSVPTSVRKEDLINFENDSDVLKIRVGRNTIYVFLREYNYRECVVI